MTLNLVVGIGGSAGALKTFEELVKTLRPGDGVSYIIIQHMDPKQKSRLAELLAQKSLLPVHVAQNNLLLEPDQIYVASAGCTLEFFGNKIKSHSVEKISERKNSIDLTFKSLAKNFRNKAVGVIVSGTGADGTEGLREIRQNGGQTLVQDPTEADFDGMPQSAISEHLANFVVPAGQMAHIIKSILEQTSSIQSSATSQNLVMSDELVMDKICSRLYQKTGNDFSSYKKTSLGRRIEKRLNAKRLSKLEDYLGLLENDEHEADLLLNDLLISVTSFFRDPETFDFIRDEIIPIVFERAGENPVRIWVPACATGEEAYTYGMLLLEHQRKHNLNNLIQIFATDIDKKALEVARKGVYSSEGILNIPQDYVTKYFSSNEQTFQVIPELRELCIFSEHNLIKDPPFSKLQLISCRNLLIYWEQDLQAKILPVLHYALEAQGHLILGPAENITGMSDTFKNINKKFRVFEKVDFKSGVNFALSSGLTRNISKSLEIPRPPNEEKNLVKKIGSYLLNHHALPAIAVSEKGDIQYFSGQTAKYLRMPTGAPTSNVFEIIHDSLRHDLYTIFYRSVKEKVNVSSLGIHFESQEGMAALNLHIRPIPGLVSMFLIIFEEVDVTQKTLTVRTNSESSDSVIYQLEQELKETRDHLHITIEQIKSSNEELLSMNEELQSANEELQTSKEELQSTNEELETVNTEISRKVEELDQANTDLQNFFANANVPIIFLNSDLKVQKFTPACVRIFRLLPTDIGRSIMDISTLIENRSFLEEMHLVLQNLQPLEREVSTVDGSHQFIMKIVPYRPSINLIGGLVLTFNEVTELKVSQAQLQKSLDQTINILESMGDAFVLFDRDWRILQVNKNHEQISHKSREEMLGRVNWELFPEGSDPNLLYWRELHKVMKERIPRSFEEYYPPLEVWTGVDAYPVPDGSVAVFYRDITAKKRAQKELEESQMLFKNLANSISQLAWMANAEGYISWYNQSWYDYTGTNLEEMQGWGWEKVHHPDHISRVIDFVKAAWIQGDPWELTFPLRNKAGEYRWFLTRGVPIKDNEGKLKGWLGTNTDIHVITEAKMAAEYQSYLNKTITDNAASSLFMMDVNGHPTFMNPAAEKLTGYKLEEIKDKPLHYAVHYCKPDGSHYPMEECPIDNAQAELKPLQNQEEIFVDKHGRIFPVSYSIAPLERDGVVVGSVLEFRDISEDKKNAELADLEKTKFQSVFIDAPACIALLRGKDLIYEKVNPRYQELYGNRQLVGKSILEAIPELRDQPFISYMQNVLKTGKPFEGKEIKAHICRIQGEEPVECYFDFTYTRVHLAGVDEYGIYTHAYDVTEKVRARRLLEEAENRLAIALRSAEMGTWELDPRTGIVKWSERTNEIFGLTPGKEQLEVATDQMHPEDRPLVVKAIEDAVKGENEGHYDIDYRIQKSDGTYRWVSAKGQAYFEGPLESKECTRFSGVIFDITEKKFFEDSLKKAIKTRDEFLSVASHELKTPLTSMYLQVQLRKKLLELKGTEPFNHEKIGSMIAADEKQVKRIIRLIDDMLDIGRISTGKLTINPENIDISDLVAEVVDRFQDQALMAGTKIFIDLEKDLPVVCDKFRIEQVITNLVTNAIKYGRETPIHVAVKRSGEMVRISVKDEGIGIPKEHHEKIFQQFERVVGDKALTGLGLGLFIVKQILSLHKGRIYVESELEKGSTFIVELPFSKNT